MITARHKLPTHAYKTLILLALYREKGLLYLPLPLIADEDGIMVTLTVGYWGLGLKIGDLVIHLFLGDLYLRIPKVGELAWNQLGLFIDRYPLPQQRQ
jgi:hypothetical protein|tara:strand:+ start:12645 stop:12938 length:294 start_codon:yes stop_codon:yes gene_type:complete